MNNVLKTLQNRGKIYGKFIDNADIAQQIKAIIRNQPNWSELSADKKEALDIIISKIARILSGNSEYIDNWHDIQGYAKLIEDAIKS